MRRAAVPIGVPIALTLSLLLTACAEPPTERGLKALVGGRLEASLDAAPIEYSVIVIAGGKIRAAGPQATTPVPKGSETMNLKGKLIRPMPYTGNVAAGQPASLIVYDADTGAPESLMQDGEWVR